MKLTEKQNTMLIVIMYNCIFTNDLCIGMVFDALEELKKMPYYKQRVKQLAGKVRNEMDMYEQTLLKKVKRDYIDFVADLNDINQDELKMDVWKLLNTTINFLTYRHVPNARTIAMMTTANTLCYGSCYNVDMCIENNPEVRQYAKSFKFLRMTRLQKAFRMLMREVDRINGKGHSYVADLNESNDILNGFKVLANKLADPHRILDLIEEYDKENEN